MKERVIKYRGEKIDIYYTVDRCTYFAACERGAPEVFDANREPWIQADAANPDKVARVIMKCPTGALHFERKDGGDPEPIPDKNIGKLAKNGPLRIHGDIEIKNFDDNLVLTDTRLSLCRCGESDIMPLCDRSHILNEFESLKKYQEGPMNELTQGKVTITLAKDGPLNVHGPLQIYTPEGETCYKSENTSLCRCGHSDNMPFCDMSHKESDFTTDEEVVLYNKDE